MQLLSVVSDGFEAVKSIYPHLGKYLTIVAGLKEDLHAPAPVRLMPLVLN
jgi:hypothetical protein